MRWKPLCPFFCSSNLRSPFSVKEPFSSWIPICLGSTSGISAFNTSSFSVSKMSTGGVQGREAGSPKNRETESCRKVSKGSYLMVAMFSVLQHLYHKILVKYCQDI